MSLLDRINESIANRHKYICVDFDGTCVTNKFPEIGTSIGAEKVLKELAENGVRLILWTVRDKEHLKRALAWFKKKDIQLYSFNRNPEATFSSSPKCFCDLYIDDLAAGAPLLIDGNGKPYVNWVDMRKILVKKGFL